MEGFDHIVLVIKMLLKIFLLGKIIRASATFGDEILSRGLSAVILSCWELSEDIHSPGLSAASFIHCGIGIRS